MNDRATDPLVYLIAGEASGDALGANLMAALKSKTGGKVRFVGIGGDLMQNQGLQSLFPMTELSIMGFSEVLPKIPKLLKRISQTTADIIEQKPDVVVSIDAPDFVFRVDKRVKAHAPAIPIVHFVAPSVWAWRPGRAKKISRFVDHLLCLLPFEPPYFAAVGLDATFVGHPVIESGLGGGDGDGFRARHSISEYAPLLSVLPGSRFSELELMLPEFGKTLALLKTTHPELSAVVVTLDHLREKIEAATNDWAVDVTIVGADEKADAFAASDAALAASGTVALELALARLPNIIGYRFKPLTSFLAQRIIKAKYANIVNLVLDRPAIPELLMGRCRADLLAVALRTLLDDHGARKAQRAAFKEALAMLGQGAASPGERAAEVVLKVITQHQKEK